jgi:phosphinothricin tripeptide acetyl hydrolase
MASAELQRLIAMMRAADPMASDDLMTIREVMRRAPAFRKPDDISWEPVDAGGVPSEWIVPDVAEPGRVIVYFHGGGYATGSAETFRGLCCHLARASRARVLNVDYRLAPEHRFPSAVDDAITAYRFAISAGYHPERMALAGDSSGAGLVLGALVALRDDGSELPAAAVCLSPLTDLTLSGASLRAKREVDPMVRESVLRLMIDAYLADADPRSPTASPLFADVRGLPPVLIQVGTAELLLDDSTRFAEQAEMAGVDVTLEVWDDMIHVWQSFADFLPEAKDAVARIGSFVDDHVGQASSGAARLIPTSHEEAR